MKFVEKKKELKKETMQTESMMLSIKTTCLSRSTASFMLLFLIFTMLSPIVIAAGAAGAECDAEKPCGFGLYCILGQCKPNLFLNSAVIVMAITFIIIAIVYMLGRVFEHARLQHWAETELWEVLGTAFILALYLGASGILDDVIGPAFYQTSVAYPGEPGLRGGSASSVPWTTVKGHVSDYLNADIAYFHEIIKGMNFIGMTTGLFSTLSINIFSATSAFYLVLFPELSSLQQFLSTVMYMLTASVVQLQLQLAIVGLWTQIFTILLPLGVLFRAFPLTRSAGSALIAIAIGFTIILPVSYLIIEDIGNHYWNVYCKNVDFSMSDILPGTGEVTDALFSTPDFLKDYIKQLLDPQGVFGCMIFKVGIESFLLPVFAYLITLNITRHLAEILGAHIDFSTLVRIV